MNVFGQTISPAQVCGANLPDMKSTTEEVSA